MTQWNDYIELFPETEQSVINTLQEITNQIGYEDFEAFRNNFEEVPFNDFISEDYAEDFFSTLSDWLENEANQASDWDDFRELFNPKSHQYIDLIIEAYEGESLQSFTFGDGLPRVSTIKAIDGFMEAYKAALSGYMDELPGEAPAPMNITNQPVSQEVNLGANYTLSVEVSGGSNIQYQWRKNGVAIDGANSNTLLLQNLTDSDSGQYDCIITNESGDAISTPATINVISLVNEASNLLDWSKYQQKISSAFRGSVQELQNHYTSIDVTFNAFNERAVEEIHSDFQSLESSSSFFIEYATTIIAFSKLITNASSTPLSITNYLLERDKPHYTILEESIAEQYTDFTVLQNEEPEILATFLYLKANEAEGFFMAFSEMLVAAQSATMWDRFILSYPILKDDDAERLVNGIQDESADTNITSFKVAQSLSNESLAELMMASSTNLFRGNLVKEFVDRAKVVLEQQPEGDVSESEQWEAYFSQYSDTERTAIQFLLDIGEISTVSQLAATGYGTVLNLMDTEFFMTLAPFYLERIAQVAEEFSSHYSFNARLLKTGENTPLPNFNVKVFDKNDTEFGDRLIATTSTNQKGYFAVSFTVLSEVISDYTLDYQFTSLEDNRTYSLQNNFNLEDEEGLTSLSINHGEEDNSALIHEISTYDPAATIPAELEPFLTTHNLITLQNVRDFGGMSNKDDLPVGTLTVAERIDAHANLELLHIGLDKSVYLLISKNLIDEGFDSIPEIIKTDRYDFIKKMKAHFSSSFKLGQYDAGKLYEQADGVMSYITTRLNQGLTDRFKDFENDPDLQDALNNLKSNKCNCEDCKAGTSPLAYLTDLINYTLKNTTEITLSDDLIPGISVNQLGNGKKEVSFDPNNAIEFEVNEDDMITHLTDGTTKFTLNELEEKFKHPFAKLPANCDSVNKKVCQVRVCIEVLWTHLFDYIADGNPNNITDSNDLVSSAKLKEIRLATYEYLLSELGTSYDEIRKFRVSTPEEKTALSQRLGINESRLEELNIPYSADNDTISDIKLEELFGYRDTTKNYVTVDVGEDLPTALVKTPKSRISTFKEEFLREQFHKSDFSDLPYSSLGRAKIDPDIIFPSDFRVPDETNALFALWQKRFDWINGFCQNLKNAKKKVSTFPKSKKLLLSITKTEIQGISNLSAIDDSENVVDLTVVGYEMNPEGTEASILVEEALPYSLKEGSTATIGGVEFNLAGKEEIDVSTENAAESGKTSIFDRLKETYSYTYDYLDADENEVEVVSDKEPWTENASFGVIDAGKMDFLYGNLKNNEYYQETLVVIQDHFALNEDQFLRLYDLFNIDRNAKDDLNSPQLSEEEVSELIDLAVTSMKNRLTVTWINEEDRLVGGTLAIDTENFWEAEKELTEGISPFPQSLAYFDEANDNLPLIDPDEINLKDLPDWKIGKAATQLFIDRKAELETSKVAIRNERLTYSESSDLGLSKTLDLVYGDNTLDTITTLAENLSSSDTTVSAVAIQEIEAQLKISLEEFTFIVALKAKCNEKDPTNQPTEEEWGQLYSMLLAPYKTNELISNWKGDESAYYAADKNTTWKLRKPKLRKWRGGSAARIAWTTELKLLKRQPIIDPYLIDPSFMKGLDADDVVFSAENRVFQIWDNRRDYLELKRQALITDLGTTQTFQHINSFLEDELKMTANFQVSSTIWALISDDLTDIKAKQDSGFGIKPILKQLGFSRKSFEFIFEIRELLKLDGSILLTPPEREEIANLLIDVLKRRFFTLWNLQEELDTDLQARYPFALSPDFFMIPPPQPFSFPLLKSKEQPQYLFNNAEFKKWKRTLGSKERIWNNNADSLERMLADTESRFLIPTRDAIIEHISNAEGQTVEETHDFITRNLLIDSKTNSCMPTTRVTQAIESLQILLWGMHNNILLDEPNIAQLTLTAPDFDSEWKWLGSYATWRSAMFIQLYPENILLPSLKLNQSDQYKTAVQQLNRVTTVATAQQVFYNYFQFLEDVKAMELLSTCRLNQGSSGIITSLESNTIPAGERSYFNFGKGGVSGKLYFRETHIKQVDGSIPRVSNWKEVPFGENGEFVNVLSVEFDGETNIYFFIKEDNKLMFSTYDFRKNNWSEYKAVEFDSPDYGVKLDLEHINFFIAAPAGQNLARPMIFIHGYNQLSASDRYESQEEGAKTDLTFEVFMMHKDQKARHYMHNDSRFKYSNGNKVEDRIYSTFYQHMEPLYVYFDDNYSNKTRYEFYIDNNGDQQYRTRDITTGDDQTALVVVCKYIYDGRGTTASGDYLYLLPFSWSKPSIWSNHIDLIPFKTNVNGVHFKNNGIIRNGIVKDLSDVVSLDVGMYKQDGSLLGDNDEGKIGLNNVTHISDSMYIPDLTNGDKLFLFLKSGNNEMVAEYKFENIGSVDTLNYQSHQEINLLPTSEEYSLVESKVKFNFEKLVELNQSMKGDSTNHIKTQLIQEGFYYLPLAIANKLTALGEYQEAKRFYDVIFNFKQNVPYFYLLDDDTAAFTNEIKVNDDWGDNPLNPHMIAASRPRSLKKSFYLQLINYFISYANHEFTQDTVESIARARQLYLEAEDLLKVIQPELADGADYESLLTTFQLEIDSPYIQSYWERLITRLVKIETIELLETFSGAAKSIWEGGGTESDRISQIELELQTAINGGQSASLADQLNTNNNRYVAASNLLANHYNRDQTFGTLAQRAGNNFDTAMQEATGFTPTALASSPLNVPFLETPRAAVPLQVANFPEHEAFYAIDVVNGGTESERGERAIKKPEEVFRSTFNRKSTSVFKPSFDFCVVPNPVYRAFELSIQLNLYKIRNSMNISGIQRSLEPFAAPTDATSGIPMIGVGGVISTGGIPIPQASAYKYEFLLQRAKELIGSSQNVEAAFLSSLEKFDDELYSILRAEQDQEVSKANVKLQSLRIDEAETGIELAELQTEGADLQVNKLDEMIDSGLNEYEQTMIQNYYTISILNSIMAGLNNAVSLAETSGDIQVGTSTNVVSRGVEFGVKTALFGVLSGLQIASDNLQANTSVRQILSAQTRRVQQWNYQKSIAQHDIKVGQKGEELAQDRLRIVSQEKSIAELQLQHTDTTINYLKNEQFSNAALYEFMVETLEKVYSYFLQEATAMAKLASQQLAFERQKQLPDFIKGDYWIPQSDSSVSSGSAEDQPDRKGITGSARLLQDITRLEQYGNSSDERKQRLTKTISLSSIAPYEFQQFRETGIITFATDMNLFDQDHPGHYLRLIKRVSTNVVALVPPVDGIKASLSSLGLSRVVTSGPLFQTQDIRRNPETISLSAPGGTNGIFELSQDQKFLQPFEGSGVETFWEFRMEKAANPNMDFNAVADVLITLEYEALNSFDYRAQVVRRLNTDNEYEAMLPISFRSNLPDQWFDISNPDQAATPFEVSFELSEASFPVNVKDPIITNVLLYFPQEGEEDEEVSLANFGFTEKGSESEVGGFGLSTSEAKISTADANGTALNGMLGKSVAGKWSLKLQDNATLRGLIEEDKLSDILMVITFAGETPKYNL